MNPKPSTDGMKDTDIVMFSRPNQINNYFTTKKATLPILDTTHSTLSNKYKVLIYFNHCDFWVFFKKNKHEKFLFRRSQSVQGFTTFAFTTNVVRTAGNNQPYDWTNGASQLVAAMQPNQNSNS
jgi:hypothetical protein